MRMWRNSARSPATFSSARANCLLKEPLRRLPTSTATAGRCLLISISLSDSGDTHIVLTSRRSKGACLGPGLPGGSRGFDELQRHAIRLADRLHLRVFAVRPGQVGRQAVHVHVFGIPGIGVDFRCARQAKTGTQTCFDHVVLGNPVQGLRTLHRIREWLGAMVGDAEHAAGLEHLERGLEHRIQRGGTFIQPVVRVAERQHHVGRTRGGENGTGFATWPYTLGSAFSFCSNLLGPLPRGGEDASIKCPCAYRNGARISVNQPPPGASSITVMSGLMPKNSSVWIGCRYWSRALLARERQLPFTASCNMVAVSPCAIGPALLAAPAVPAITNAPMRTQPPNALQVFMVQPSGSERA